MEEELLYYENKLDIIIWLLNHSKNEDVDNYLLNSYYETYEKYEKLCYKIHS